MNAQLGISRIVADFNISPKAELRLLAKLHGSQQFTLHQIAQLYNIAPDAEARLGDLFAEHKRMEGNKP